MRFMDRAQFTRRGLLGWIRLREMDMGREEKEEKLWSFCEDSSDFNWDFERTNSLQLCHVLGCGFPVCSADFWLCLCKFCGEADRGRLAGQQREFKTYRKSTAQIINRGILLLPDFPSRKMPPGAHTGQRWSQT